MELDLSLNFLSSIPVGALAQLGNLKYLSLGSNRIQVSATSRIREVNHVFHEPTNCHDKLFTQFKTQF